MVKVYKVWHSKNEKYFSFNICTKLEIDILFHKYSNPRV